MSTIHYVEIAAETTLCGLDFSHTVSPIPANVTCPKCESILVSQGLLIGMADDAVNHPKHYNADPSGVECLQIVRHRNFNVGNAIKYLWRAGLKGGGEAKKKLIEDLNKAMFYIADEIVRLGGEVTWKPDKPKPIEIVMDNNKGVGYIPPGVSLKDAGRYLQSQRGEI